MHGEHRRRRDHDRSCVAGTPQRDHVRRAYRGHRTGAFASLCSPQVGIPVQVASARLARIAGHRFPGSSKGDIRSRLLLARARLQMGPVAQVALGVLAAEDRSEPGSRRKMSSRTARYRLDGARDMAVRSAIPQRGLDKGGGLPGECAFGGGRQRTVVSGLRKREGTGLKRTRSVDASRPVAVDLFAGAGGMSLGFEQAGFDVAAAVELDPIHASVHKFNHPNCTVFPRSVVGLSGSYIRSEAGIGERSVAVVIGGAPCQGFSMIGKRALDDPRNGLVKEFVRLVVELDAEYFVFENVKGLTIGRHRIFLEDIIDTFDAVGYSVERNWRVLDAVWYGVPQHRERLILLGAKRGRELPRYPGQRTQAAGSAGVLFPNGPSCRDAIGDIPDAELYEELSTGDSVDVDVWGEPSNYARTMRCRSNDSWSFGYARNWNPAVLTSSNRTDHTSISRRRFSETKPGTVEPVSRFYRLHPEGVSNTLRAGTDSARGAFTSPRPIHYEFARCVTVREMARLHGFPDWFRLNETKWHGARQVGNSVPPPMAKSIADEVMKTMGLEPVVPDASVELGDPALLSMDMKHAADYWGVPVPIGRRNLKSKAKKRRQIDIESERLSDIGGTARA